MFSKINNILWPELWLLKFYFHQHYHCAAIGHPFLISYLFQHGHFFSSWLQLFYSQGVFGWDKIYQSRRKSSVSLRRVCFQHYYSHYWNGRGRSLMLQKLAKKVLRLLSNLQKTWNFFTANKNQYMVMNKVSLPDDIRIYMQIRNKSQWCIIFPE